MYDHALDVLEILVLNKKYMKNRKHKENDQFLLINFIEWMDVRPDQYFKCW